MTHHMNIDREDSTIGDDAAEGDAPVAPPGGPRRRRWPMVAAVALVGVAAVLGVWGATQRSDAEESGRRLDDQREAVLVASGFVEALLSYDHEDLDAQQAAVERYATEQFRAEYTDAFTSDVRDQIVSEQASSTVTVQDAWLSVDGGDEVSAVVHAISSVSSAGGATAELESYLRVGLVRIGGRWQVNDLTSLGSRDLDAPMTSTGAEGGGPEDDG